MKLSIANLLTEMNIAHGPRNIVHLVIEQHGDPETGHGHYVCKCQNEYFHKETKGQSAAEALVEMAHMMHRSGFME